MPDQPNNQNESKMVTFEDGIITLGGKELPGIMTDIRVSGSVRFDEQKLDGQSGKNKTPQGYEDCEISASLDLLTDSESTCYEKLEELNAIFRNIDDKANPVVCTAASRHLQARGIRQIVFSRLDSVESDADDYVRVSVSFVEHNPPIVRTEKDQAKSPTASELKEQAQAAASGAAPTAEAEEVITVDVS